MNSSDLRRFNDCGHMSQSNKINKQGNVSDIYCLLV